MEVWKDVVGYEGYYEVSSYGRVRSVGKYVNVAIRYNNVRYRKGRVLKLNLKRNGYLTVDLSKDNKTKTISVHRIVAMAFLPMIEGKNVVNHINLNKLDNRVENLEWTTHKENSQHAASHGVMYGGLRKLIRCCETGELFESSYKAAEWLNKTKFQYSKQIETVSKNIRACCCGTKRSAYGYHWKDVIQEGSTTNSCECTLK